MSAEMCFPSKGKKEKVKSLSQQNLRNKALTIKLYTFTLKI